MDSARLRQLSKTLGFYRSIKDEYFSGPRKRHEDGSIELWGKRWGLVGLILTPPLLFMLPWLQLVTYFKGDEAGWPTWALVVQSVFSIAYFLATVVLFIGTPRRHVLLEANIGSILVEHKGLTRRGEFVVNLEEIRDVRVVEPAQQSALQRTRLYLVTGDQELYLMSIGRYHANAGLPEEIRTLVKDWNDQRDTSIDPS